MTSCEDCDLPYEQFGCDLVLPDQQWRVIASDVEGLLCPTCICKRLVKHQATVVLCWATNLIYAAAE